jgi:hypothetical protein
MPISVKAVGKPSMMATTTSDSISRPRWPLVMVGALSSMTSAAIDDQRHQDEAEPEFLADLHRWLLARDTNLSSACDVLVLHVHHLLELVDVDFLHVLLARGPGAPRGCR